MNITSSDLKRAAEILSQAHDDSPEQAMSIIAQMLRNLTHDRLLDSVRIDWLAQCGSAIKLPMNVHQIIRWSDCEPIRDTRINNLRRVIDDAIRSEEISGLSPRRLTAGVVRCDGYRVRCPKCFGRGWLEGSDGGND